ncbi:BrnA antitoxin family protein [Patescibacteria group bacterium]|nr:BrnA antitoxin family protein [Patescibacteria group bacterium]MBU4017282.1 BrnA antitoxin family protein [Patescibacteria group bacterium]MBU4099557.1 BrnA antitoxin family protein [Patescibacteria group bacterium]
MNKTKKLVPNESVFKDQEKEADFWEKNFNEVFDKGKPTKVSFAKNLSETLNIRLDPTTINIVRDEAKAKGLGPTQLIRMWIMERIGKKSSHVPGV